MQTLMQTQNIADAGERKSGNHDLDGLLGKATFEETAYLLSNGELPSPPALAIFKTQLRANRCVHGDTLGLLSALREAHTTDALRTAIAFLGAHDPERDDQSPRALRRKATRLLAKLPTIVAAHHALREGRAPVTPRPDLGFAANFLWMIHGTEPAERAVELLDSVMSLHAEYGASESAPVLRMAAWAQADYHASMLAAFGMVSGTIHGGTPDRVVRLMREIGTPERAAAHVERKLACGEPIPGLGHGNCSVADARARRLRDLLDEYPATTQSQEILATLDEVVTATACGVRHGMGVYAEFYYLAALAALGIPDSLAVPVLAMSALPGWTGHRYRLDAAEGIDATCCANVRPDLFSVESGSGRTLRLSVECA